MCELHASLPQSAHGSPGCGCCPAANKQSLYVSYAHISQAMPILAVWVADVPNQMFQIFNRVGEFIGLPLVSVLS